MHKRLVEPALARLDSDRATYFAEVAHRLENDSRCQENANVIFMVLADTCVDLPPHLGIDEFNNRLIRFAHERKRPILKLLYSKEFLHDPGILRQETKAFVTAVIDEIMRQASDGTLEHDEPTVFTFGPDDDPAHFPYADPDDDIDEEDVLSLLRALK